MKKVFLSVLILALCNTIHAQSCVPTNGVQCTQNLNLWVPPFAYPNWNVATNANWNTIDASSVLWAKINASIVTFTGIVNSVGGFQVNGSYLSTGNLADWTNTGIANGYTPVWNSTTNKWTPGPAGGAGKEPALGNPSTNGYVLSSTTGGSRSWVANGVGGGFTLNGLSPTVNLVGGSGISVTPDGSSLTIINTGSGSPALYDNVLNYGAVADLQPLQLSPVGGRPQLIGVLTAGSSTIVVSAASFVSGDVGKWIAVSADGTYTTPFPVSQNSSGNYAKIVSVTDGQHIVLSKTSSQSENVTTYYGTDFSAPMNACYQAQANFRVGSAVGGTCGVPAGQYLAATYAVDQYGNNVYFTPGAYDGGDFGQSYDPHTSGNTAVITATVSSGQIASYSVTSGGSNYPPNGHGGLNFTYTAGTVCLNISVPCGGVVATWNANSSGVITSVTPVFNGYGLMSAPTVGIYNEGGDGATVSSTSLSSGTSTGITVNTGGGGYPFSTSSVMDVIAINATGGTCTSIGGGSGGIPAIVGKGTLNSNSSGAVTSGGWSIAPSGCGTNEPLLLIATPVAGGNLSAADQLCWNATNSNFSSSCTNLAPLLPEAIPMNIFQPAGANMFGTDDDSGQGTYILSVWNQVETPTPGAMLTQPALLAGQFQNVSITGISLNGFIDVLPNNNFNFGALKKLHLYGAIGILSPTGFDLGSKVDDIFFETYAAWANGGYWSQRSDGITGNGGEFDIEEINNLTIAPPASYNATSAAIDLYINALTFNAQFSEHNQDFYEQCAYGGIAANQRQTSQNVYGIQSANQMCAKGWTNGPLVNLSRNNGHTGAHSFYSPTYKFIQRPAYIGRLGAVNLTNLSCEGFTPLVSDPWRAESAQEGVIEFEAGNGSYVQNVGCTPSSGSIPALYDVGSAVNGTPGVPEAVKWDNASAFGTSATQNLNIQAVIQNMFGENLSWNTSNGAPSTLTFTNATGGGTIAGGLKGDGYGYSTFGLWGQGFTNKLMDFGANSVSILVPLNGTSANFSSTISAGGGTNILYRCTVAGTLRVGQTTTVSGDCGTAVDTGLRVN